MFGPLNKRQDGTFVFASPIGSGHVPMIALPDLGYFARYTFDHREETSGKDLEVASEMVQWDVLVKTFEKVTGNKAEYKPVALDEWFVSSPSSSDRRFLMVTPVDDARFEFFADSNRPVAADHTIGDGSTTWKKNFSGWWGASDFRMLQTISYSSLLMSSFSGMFRDDVAQRDMSWIRSVHPNGYTVERSVHCMSCWSLHPSPLSRYRWMKENNYGGQLDRRLLKIVEDDKMVHMNMARLAKL